MSFLPRHYRSVFSAALALALGGLSAGALADEAADQYAVAAGHYSHGRWQMAFDEFEGLLRDHPDGKHTCEVKFFAAEALVQLGRTAEAETRLAEVVERWPTSSFARQAQFRRAETAYVGGRYKHARGLLEDFISKYPDDDPLNAHALVYLAETLLEEGGAQRAAELFAKAIEHYPTGPLVSRCRLGQAKAAVKLGNLDEARQQYRQLIAAEDKASAEGRLLLGLLENKAGQFEAALEALAPLTDERTASPLAPRATLASAWALHKLDRNGEAADRLAKLLEQNPEDLEACYWLGIVQAAQQQWPQAIESLSQVVKQATDPERVTQARAALAVSYARVDQITEARGTYEAFLEGQPPAELVGSTTYHLAEAAYGKDTDWAAELFRKLAADESSPAYAAQGLSGLAWCQLQSADVTASAATFEQLLAKYPDEPLAAEAALARGRALEKLHQPAEALAMYERVLAQYPKSPRCGEARWNAARLEHRLGKFKEAESRYRELAAEPAAGVPQETLLYNWSQTLEALGEQGQATELLQRLRQEFPKGTLAAETAFRLAQGHFAKKQYVEAQALLDEVIAIEPPPTILPQALDLAGRGAMESERWSDAESHFERLAKQSPDSPLGWSARYWLAEVAYRQKNYEQAAAALGVLDAESAGREEKWLPTIPLRQAQALGQLGRWDEALAVANKIAERYPNFTEQPEVDLIIGRALAAQAEFDKAREAYARVLRASQGGKTEAAAMAQWLIGESYFHQDNYAAAMAAYLKVEILYDWPKWQATALLQAGKCQEKLGQWKDAAESYHRLVQHFADSQFVTEAKQRIEAIQQRLGQQVQKQARRSQ